MLCRALSILNEETSQELNYSVGQSHEKTFTVAIVLECHPSRGGMKGAFFSMSSVSWKVCITESAVTAEETERQAYGQKSCVHELYRFLLVVFSCTSILMLELSNSSQLLSCDAVCLPACQGIINFEVTTYTNRPTHHIVTNTLGRPNLSLKSRQWM